MIMRIPEKTFPLPKQKPWGGGIMEVHVKERRENYKNREER